MNAKNEELNINKVKSKNHSKNEIIIKYKINKNDNKIKLFGKLFVIHNKKNCKIMCEDKLYDLNEFFDLTNYNKSKDILEIKLIIINNITNMSHLFSD